MRKPNTQNHNSERSQPCTQFEKVAKKPARSQLISYASPQKQREARTGHQLIKRTANKKERRGRRVRIRRQGQ